MNVFRATAAILVASLVAAKETHAEVTVVAVEEDGNVIFSGEGTFDLTELRRFQLVISVRGTLPDNGASPPQFTVGGMMGDGSTSVSATTYGGAFTEFPARLGSGGLMRFDSNSGDFFGMTSRGSTPTVTVPRDYESGDFFSGSGVFFEETFESLGMDPGTYVWAWGSGDTADSLTLLLVPEPAAGSLALIGLFVASHRRQRTART